MSNFPAERATQLGMFAKHWQSGKVKTRLARDIGPDAAASIYRAFVQTLLARFAGNTARHLLCYSPPSSRQAFARLPLGTWQLAPQAEGDLGSRMRHYLQDAFDAGMQRVLLIGSDSPDLPTEYIAQALDALQNHPVVLGPTEDGGYYLVGASRLVPPIFEGIAWSTSSVLSQTLERLEQAGLTPHLLPEWYDVDEVADLQRLLAGLKHHFGHDSPLAELSRELSAALSQHPEWKGR